MNSVIDEDFEKSLGANPFACGDFKIVVRKLLDFEKLTISDGIYVPTENILEQEKFVKVYTGDKREKSKLKIGIGEVNEYGLELLWWIIMRLKSGEDYFFLDKATYMSEKSISSVNTFKKSRNELIAKGVITATMQKNYFWINPKFIFCGSRVNKYPTKVVEYKPKNEVE